MQLLNHSPRLIDLKAAHDHTALHLAALRGQSYLLSVLNQADNNQRTALHFAAANGHDEIVARLLAHNPALIDAVTFFDNMKALHSAASEGHETIVLQLLNHSPGLIDLKTACDQKTALHIAASRGHVKVVAELLAFSPQSCDARGGTGRTALHFAAECGQNKVVVQLLAHNPALIDAVTSGDEKMTALQLAAWRGYESTVVQLLSHSPGLIDLKTAHDNTALHIAALQNENVKVTNNLLFLRVLSLHTPSSLFFLPSFSLLSFPLSFRSPFLIFFCFFLFVSFLFKVFCAWSRLQRQHSAAFSYRLCAPQARFDSKGVGDEP